MQQYDIEEHCMDFTSSSSESEDGEAQKEEMDFQKRVHKRMVKSIGGHKSVNRYSVNNEANLFIKGGESSSQFRWFTIDKIEL